MSVKETRIEGYNLGAVAGQAHERERIIKLLEELDKPNRQPCSHSGRGVNYPCGGCGVYLDPVSLIALIRGEDK